MNPRVSLHELAGAKAGRNPGHQDLLTLTFDDNRLLASVFGEHDEHLALIENKLGVALTPRGNRVAVRGSEEACASARSVLASLYNRARQGHDIPARRCRRSRAHEPRRGRQGAP